MYNQTAVLGIVKARLNRLASDTSLDEYLIQRISAVDLELKSNGINLAEDNARDAVFLADVVVWQYGNRDNSNAMPEWLRLARRERWLKERVSDDS